MVACVRTGVADLFIQMIVQLEIGNDYVGFQIGREQLEQVDVVSFGAYDERRLAVVVLGQTVRTVVEQRIAQMQVVVFAGEMEQRLVEKVFNAVHVDQIRIEQLDEEYVVALCACGQPIGAAVERR